MSLHSDTDLYRSIAEFQKFVARRCVHLPRGVKGLFGERLVDESLNMMVTMRHANTPLGVMTIDRSTGQAVSCVLALPASAPIESKKVVAECIGSSMAAMGLALRVLNCANVTTETISAPERLNKKRASKERPPIYEYKVLCLKSQSSTRLNGGTHGSPRIHLRRGHIKHRKTGDFWWQPHVVGDRQKGMVVKDYDASTLTP